MMLASTTVLAATIALSTASLIVPDWDYAPKNVVDECVDATSRSNGNENARWVTYALPEGTPPSGGWPVYLDLVTDNFPVPGKTCGTPTDVRKKFVAFSTPNEAVGSCYGNSSSSVRHIDSACDDAMEASCLSAAKHGVAACLACANQGPIPKGSCNKFSAFEWCEQNHGGGGASCMYDQQAGALWDQRMKQYLVANGVAVLQANPVSEDSWDAFEAAWDGKTQGSGGVDKPFLGLLFEEMSAGKFGSVDMSKVVIRGWSSGAQMVSWLFQVTGSNSSTFTSLPKFAGGVFLSGGSYACYNDPQVSPVTQPVGSCSGCTEGGPSHCADDPKCSSCDPTVKTYCQQCCPRNYTEQFYADHPEKYVDHPPVFLGQLATGDSHADACACKNYYESMQTNAPNVLSVLSLVTTEDASCFCVGNPANPNATGSPFSSECSKPDWGQNCGVMGGPDCCITHTFGFADMVVPAVNFVLAATSDTV